MPSACDKSNGPSYKIGHNPPIFSTGISGSECQARDVPVENLTAKSGAWWNDLRTGRLRAVSWITPNTSNDGGDSCGSNCALSIADTWLQSSVSLVKGSSEYRSGTTAIFVTYDEASAPITPMGSTAPTRPPTWLEASPAAMYRSL